MSLPPLNPQKTTAGIAVDPRTLERVIPESRRPDGTVRKQIKIRPGFTPQEDVQRFRGSRQQAMDARALPKGQIMGWVAPSAPAKKEGESKPLSKSAKKNEKRKEKRKQEQEKKVLHSWESDSSEGEQKAAAVQDTKGSAAKAGGHTSDTPNKATTDSAGADAVAEKLEKLKV
ncbi:hypothetical protein DENSPDRAFT_830938 [Dentipellis sp. KUC8613]|nr:hypothetical protein DENSPDRAFT_830938 [Dentipellis sp. KUC8613]